MENFVRAHEKEVIGLLNGFDRLVFRGTIRRLALVGGMASYLHAVRVLLKDFEAFAEARTGRPLGRPDRVTTKATSISLVTFVAVWVVALVAA